MVSGLGKAWKAQGALGFALVFFWPIGVGGGLWVGLASSLLVVLTRRGGSLRVHRPLVGNSKATPATPRRARVALWEGINSESALRPKLTAALLGLMSRHLASKDWAWLRRARQLRSIFGVLLDNFFLAAAFSATWALLRQAKRLKKNASGLSSCRFAALTETPRVRSI